MRSAVLSRVSVGIVAVLFAGACNMIAPRETRTVTRSIELDKAESVDVELDMGAGELKVGGGAPKLMDASFRFNVPTWEPVVDYESGARAQLRVKQPSGATSFGRTENTWDVRFNDTVP